MEAVHWDMRNTQRWACVIHLFANSFLCWTNVPAERNFSKTLTDFLTFMFLGIRATICKKSSSLPPSSEQKRHLFSLLMVVMTDSQTAMPSRCRLSCVVLSLLILCSVLLWPLWLYGIPYMVRLWPSNLQLCSGWKAHCDLQESAASQNQRVKGQDSWKWGNGVWSVFFSIATIPSFTLWCTWE